jgi:hypothetical protein
MSHRPYPPAYLRYLKARLWNLGKPSVWGTALFLSVVGLVIRGYWFNPNVVTSAPKNAVAPLNTKSSLSAEDKAIAADIDNLPVLFNDAEQASLSISKSTPQEDSQVKNSKNLFEDVISQPSSNDEKSNSGLGIVNNTSPSPEKNLFVLQTENILRFGTVDSPSQSLGVKSITPSSQPTQTLETSSKLGMGLVNQTDKNQNINSISPPNQTQSNFNSPTSIKTNSSESDGGVMQNFRPNSSTNQTFSTNTGYIQPTVANQLPSQVQSIPITNITPYSIQNSKPNAMGEAPPSAIAPTTPGVSSNFTWQQPTQLPQSNLPVTNGIQNNTYQSP